MNEHCSTFLVSFITRKIVNLTDAYVHQVVMETHPLLFTVVAGSLFLNSYVNFIKKIVSPLKLPIFERNVSNRMEVWRCSLHGFHSYFTARSLNGNIEGVLIIVIYWSVIRNLTIACEPNTLVNSLTNKSVILVDY